MDDDGFEWVEYYLDIWVRDQRSSKPRLGAPKKAAGFIGGGYGENRELMADWQDEADHKAIGVIDATLEDMTPVERAAVAHVKSYAVFRFPREPVEAAYRRARIKIGIRLRAADFN